MFRVLLKKSVAFLLAVALAATHFLLPIASSIPLASAAFNPEINYQGRLLDAAGDAVTDDTYNIQFKLHTALSGGSVVWTETHCYSPDSGATCDGTGTDSRVETIDGLFSVMLGSVNSLADVDFNQELYLSVNIGGTGTTPSYDGEMTPRKVLGAVPAAFVADTLDGVESDQFFRNDIVNATSSATTSLAIVQNGAGKIAEFFGPSYTSVMSILSSGEVGIGTSTPDYAFQVHRDATQADLAVTTNTNVGAGNTATLQFVSDNDGTPNAAMLGQFGDGSLRFSGASSLVTPDMVITDDGFVGIGTTSPYARLSVVGQLVSEYFTATSTTASSTFPRIDTTDIEIAGKLYDGSASAGTNGYVLQTTGTGITWVATSSLGISGGSSQWTTSGSDIYYSTGNVGIGTTTPMSDLSISAGTGEYAAFAVDTNASMLNMTTVGNGSTGINLTKGTGVGTGLISFYYGATNNGVIGLDAANNFSVYGGNAVTTYVGAGNSGVLQLGAGASGVITFTPNNTEAMRITSAGNVGIGNTSPSEKLNVQGEVAAQNFSATSTTATSTFAGDVRLNGSLLLDGLYGTSGMILQSTGTGTTPVWTATSALGITASVGIGSSITSGTAGSVLYIDSSGNLAQDNAGFYYDATNNYLNLGTSTDALVIGDITGNARGQDAIDIQSNRSAATQVAGGNQSVALGYRNTASTVSAVAIGTANAVSGSYGASLGSSNTASASYTYAIGHNNTVSGQQSIGAGIQNSVSGTYAAALGALNSAGNYSVAIGYSNQANALSAFAAGYANTASGGYSVAVGYSNTASGGSSYSFGGDNENVGGNSIAAGYLNTIVNGSYNHAFGYNNTVSTVTTGYSTALGNSNDIYSDNSTAVGYDNYIDENSDASSILGFGNTVNNGGNDSLVLGNANSISASYSTSIGYANISSGGTSVTLGNSNTAEGSISFAGGYSSYTGGQYALAFGYDNEASGVGSLALGYDNSATQNYASAVGSLSSASGLYSSAFGYRVRSTAQGASVFGGGGNGSATNMTNSVANSTLIGPGATTSIHILGTGEVKLPYFTATSTTGTSTISHNLSVGGIFDAASTTGTSTVAHNFSILGTTTVGTILPSSSLTYSLGSSDRRWNEAWVGTLNVGTSTWSLTQSDSGRFSIFDQASGAGTERFTIAPSGNVGIGTTTPSGALSLGQTANSAAGGLWIAATDGDYRSMYMDTDQVLNFNGGSGNTATLNAAGAWTNASDIAYKENIEQLDYGLEEIMLLNPRRYTWKSDGTADIGFIAQELEQVIPEVVFGQDGSKTVSYGQLTSLAISGLQDIGMRIDLFNAPTSTPSLTLDAEGKLIVNNGFTVQNEAQIGSLNVLESATFEQGLQVLGTSTSSFGGALLIEGSVTLGAGDITITSNGVEAANGFAINESQFYVATSGAIGIGTTSPARMLHVVREGEGSPVRFQDTNGYCEINPTTASLVCTSDESLKENITELTSTSVLEQLRALKPVTFEWLTDKTDTERVGFIAQEVEVVIPELVYTDPETGLKSVAYGGFVPYIVSAIKELVTRVDTLTSQIESLAARVEALASQGYGAASNVFQTLRVGSPQQPSGITIYDEETGAPYCLTAKNGSLVTRSGECGTPIDEVTHTTEQHVFEEGGEGTSTVEDGGSINPNDLLEIAPTSTAPDFSEDVPAALPDLVPETVESTNDLPDLELVIEEESDATVSLEPEPEPAPEPEPTSTTVDEPPAEPTL